MARITQIWSITWFSDNINITKHFGQLLLQIYRNSRRQKSPRNWRITSELGQVVEFCSEGPPSDTKVSFIQDYSSYLIFFVFDI